jgi:diaminobutyrate-2-oxoglutarate transaminase
MMLGLDVHDGALAGAICVRAYDKGLVIETSGNRDQVIKILAPLTTPTQTLQKGFELLRQAAFEVMTETQAMAAE